MNEYLKAKARKMILDLLQYGQFPLVEDSPQTTRVALALMMGEIIATSKLQPQQHTKVWLATLDYLSDATDKEIISLFREGTAASVN